MEGSRHSQADLDPFVKFFPEIAREQLVAIGGNCLWQAEVAIPGSVHEKGDVLGCRSRVGRFELDVVGEPVGHDEDSIESFGGDECSNEI